MEYAIVRYESIHEFNLKHLVSWSIKEVLTSSYSSVTGDLITTVLWERENVPQANL